MLQKHHLVSFITVFVIVLLGAGGMYYFSREGKKTIIVPHADERQAATSSEPVAAPTQIFVVDATAATELYKAGEKVTPSSPDKLPEAVKFQSFAYDPNKGKIISITGKCADAYYALVIFSARDDYRKDPARAKFNRAFECPKSRSFATTVDLKDFNLPAGEYYFFIADQGERGTWYNPR